jgi:hypothetical protein
MILDGQGRVTGQTAPQAITATAVSVDSVGLLQAGRDVGPGEEVRFQVRVGAAFNNLTSLTVELVASTVTALTSPVVLVQSAAIPLAQLTAGRTIFEGVIPGNRIPANALHLGFRFVPAGTAPTQGSVVGDIGVMDIQSSFVGGVL